MKKQSWKKEHQNSKRQERICRQTFNITLDKVIDLKNQLDNNYYDKADMRQKVRDLEDKVDEMENNNDN